MRLRKLVIAGLLAAASAGCGEEFLGNARRNFVVAPDRAVDERILERRSEHWADEAWQQVCGEDADGKFTPDFEDGFKCGFVDYVTRGGNGNPPATPPIRYQEFGAKTVPGARNEEAKEWFAGFRLGAAEAMKSGYREDVIIPLASPPINAVENRPTLAENAAANPLTVPAPPDRINLPLPNPADVGPAKELPPPRPIP